jgi:hypothetical protein
MATSRIMKHALTCAVLFFAKLSLNYKTLFLEIANPALHRNIAYLDRFPQK